MYMFVDVCGESPCANNGECQPLVSGGYRCQCSLGYSGTHCELGNSISVMSQHLFYKLTVSYIHSFIS